MKKISDYEIMDYYFKKSKEFDIEELSYNSKMAGNIFAMLIRKYIKEILKDTNYDVSINNSYIEGIRNEWDLLIIRKDAFDNDVNIYNENDVKCVIELKTATYFKGFEEKIDKNNDEINKDRYKKDIRSRFSKYDEKLTKCRYLYISLFQNSNHDVDKILEEEINNMKVNKGKKSVFFFRVDTKYSDPCKKDDAYRNEEISKFTKENAFAFYHFITDCLK